MKLSERMMTVLLLLVLAGRSLSAAIPPEWKEWNRPVDPFRIAGNVFYVGASDITSFLIETPEGLILIDGGFRETAPLIQANVQKLGFRMQDIRILLNNHAHIDHAAGLAELKRITGAVLVASKEDAELLARGGKDDFQWGDELAYEPVVADRIVADGGTVELGGVVLTAHLTPGHTKGCTTWTMNVVEQGKTLSIVFLGSMTAPGYTLINNKRYPAIVDDYLQSFRKLRSLNADVFLSSHGSVFRLDEKRKRLHENPAANPFVQPGEFREYLERTESDFRKQVETQKQEGTGPTPSDKR